MRRLNRWVALRASAGLSSVAAMWTFAALGLAGIFYAFTGNVVGALIVNAVSGQFLQLVSLPVIAIAQRMQAEQTAGVVAKVDDLEATHEARHLHILDRLDGLHRKVDER